MKTLQCHITKQFYKPEEVHRGDLIRQEIFELIQKEYPDFDRASYICLQELGRFRKMYIHQLIDKESGEITALEQEVLEAITKNTVLSSEIDTDIEQDLTVGQKIADVIAKFGGSWTFILIFFFTFIVWVTTNVWLLAYKPFDPYPFILLNLVLSCLAAIQAPVIMMSQNRMEEKDRKRAEQDYKVNLKAELEIRLLDEKIEHLMTHQYKRLLEIQELQTDYLLDLLDKIKDK